MAAPKTTVWELEPHTRAKHEILKRYLHAWIPILTQGGFPHVLYIDGFAGPGRYTKGEERSPIIALHSALNHKSGIKGKILFLFIEKDKKRAQVLHEIVEEIESPDNFRIKVAMGETFETAFRETHYKRQVLSPLELAEPPLLEVINPPSSRTRGTYGKKSLKLRFLGKAT